MRLEAVPGLARAGSAILQLAPSGRPPHNVRMSTNSPFFTKVEQDADRPGRYRWFIFENGRMRDASVYSFATKREAQADADKFVQRLNDTWTDRK